MATIVIAGNSFIVKSSVSLDDYNVLAKYRPSALELRDEETKELTFRVGFGNATLSQYGIVFDLAPSQDGMAIATLGIPQDVSCSKEYVADRVGSSLAALNTIEAGIETALHEVNTEREALMESITVMV